MTPPELKSLLEHLVSGWEHECVEFKAVNDRYSTSDIGKYFSALGNEANLCNLSTGWLVFGVHNKTRSVVGTTYRLEHARLHSLKHQIAQGTEPRISFREIHELHLPIGRVILFEIPAAPRGMPVAWQGLRYARDGESLTALNVVKEQEILAQSRGDDWSIGICSEATLEDLDAAAIAKAREVFFQKYGESLPDNALRTWDTATFLDAAKLTIRGRITRTALLLLGRSEATVHLSPGVAELTWKLEGEELAYEHFRPPFLLATSRLYQRIRNTRLTVLAPGQLIPIELAKYEQRIVLEALHNCIAHQDYTFAERILVTERPGELIFQNAGAFFDGTPEDYVLRNRTPTRYRNRFLAEAMVNLRMIDTMGFGIREVMFRGQARRYLPLPEYDLSSAGHVILRLPGRFLDENYSRVLLSHPDLRWSDVFALDQVQKGLVPASEAIASLRQRKLIEGRKPHLHISASLALATGRKADYIRTRRQADEHYRKLILDYIAQWGGASRQELRTLLWDKLPDGFSDPQRESKIHNLLSAMRRAGAIVNAGTQQRPRWVPGNG